MKTPEEIENIINKALDDFTFVWQSHKEKKEGVKKYAEEILTQCQQDNAEIKWISMKEETPKGRVNVCLGFNGDAPEYNQHVFVFTWFDQNKAIKVDHSFIGTITHWMPMPKDPTNI